jgi:hypothetical protein
MHTNGISYDPGRDQIVISSHTLNEFWVLDPCVSGSSLMM